MVLRKRINREMNPVGGPVWLTTFNDLVTLLMVFFVLLFSMGTIDVKRYKHFQNALQSAMGTLYAGKHAPIGTPLNRHEDTTDSTETMVQKNNDGNQLENLETTEGIEAVYTPKGIQLTLNDSLLFTSGSAEITGPGKALLLRISRVIKPLERHIRVEGHTDNIPIQTNRYPSNWELSTERAINVVQIFIQAGGILPQHLSAVGYGDVKPKASNDTAHSRSRNRRVEIILERAKETPLLK